MAQCGLDNLPNTSPPKWFRWSAPSAHASSPLMPADEDVHHMRVVGLQIQSNNQCRLLFLLGRSAQCGLYLVKGQDQGDLGALDRSRCGRFHDRLPRWLHRRGLWELGFLRLHSRCFEACHKQCGALVWSGTCEILAEI